MSTEDWQDPVSSQARPREQARALVRGYGTVVTEFFDVGESRTVAWGRRPQAAALVAQLPDTDRGWEAIVIGDAAMAPLFEHYGAELWMPEAGGRVDYCLEPDPETAHVVWWMFAQRLAGHSVARIARALNEAGIPCPSAADPGRNPHRSRAVPGRWRCSTQRDRRRLCTPGGRIILPG